MRSSHTPAAVSAVFDDDSLIGYGGLDPVMHLAEQCGLSDLVSDYVRIMAAANSGGANPAAKVMSVVAGMVAGADGIDDLGRLRHGGMGVLFDDIRAPSTAGTFPRSFTHGHNRQLSRVHRGFLAELAAMTPVLPGADGRVLVDVDPTHVRVYGRAKQGAEIGRFKGRRTLHPLLSTIGTLGHTPVIGPARPRRGKAGDVRGAASFVAEAISCARRAGASGEILVRADSRFYTHTVVAACQRADARFSPSTGINPSITRAIGQIPDDAWVEIGYPNPIEDPETGQLISRARVAETEYTAFGSRPRDQRVTGWLVVRRVPDLSPAAQGELFPVHRYHPFLTDNTDPLVEAERTHRQHAIVESVIADVRASALAHPPSGHLQANNAWPTLTAIAHNLTRAAGRVASPRHAHAETATLRDQLIQIPARAARSARRLVIHLPRNWPWRQAWQRLFDLAHPSTRSQALAVT